MHIIFDRCWIPAVYNGERYFPTIWLCSQLQKVLYPICIQHILGRKRLFFNQQEQYYFIALPLYIKASTSCLCQTNRVASTFCAKISNINLHGLFWNLWKVKQNHPKPMSWKIVTIFWISILEQIYASNFCSEYRQFSCLSKHQ